MPTVDLSFRLLGASIPADHGYALYAAVSRLIPWVHDPARKSLGIHPVNGRPAGNRLLHLTPASRLTLRLDSDHIRELLPLAGEELELDALKVRIGTPTTYALKPAAALRSRLVTIKLKDRLDPDSFLAAVQEDLTALGTKGTPGLLKRRAAKPLEGRSGGEPDRSPFVRRTLEIRGRQVVGYAVIVQGLAADESLRLQERGLGGRRRFGCGIFVPLP
ncbi:MAG TPA: type I-MYXAN CRISPR-associated protein Cas6/Cmx6 [candidate division WOR-3 bacterium]|uniref:Type I-MYXAN CRISPR-associated protein Cas6/Cmx6 n=1 Tax=candidate division WOR-3 bacterium TaxID=2052148 RepID=A0A7V0XF73_UNCW3|nr:type I-MYXAN CRISPR-associated protein Cas6/Cmx6 [candidate division WOR-3 bacterium]